MPRCRAAAWSRRRVATGGLLIAALVLGLAAPLGRRATAEAQAVQDEPRSAPASAAPTCAASALTIVPRQRISLTCGGFPPGSRVRIYWQGRPRSLTSFTAAPDGSGSVAVGVPEIAAGSWYARASDGAGLAAVVRFVVPAPSFVTTRLLAPVGTLFDATVRGYWAGEPVALRWYAIDGSRYSTLRTATASGTGAAAGALTVPGRSVTGPHRLEAVGAVSGLVTTLAFTVTSAPVPYLDQGVAGCNRIAFIFNVGIGQPLDTGVLDTLRDNRVPATMFLSGWWAAANPELARRLRDDGYVIGSHGDGRGVLTGLSDAGVAADVQLAHEEISAALGQPPAPWLTPYAAAIDDRVRQIVWEQGYTPVGWRVSAGDWRVDATETAVYANVVNRVYDGAIVEFHIDGLATAQLTGRALPRIIATLRERGYRFVTIPEMAQPCAAAVKSTTALFALNSAHSYHAGTPRRLARPIGPRRYFASSDISLMRRQRGR